MTRRPPRATRTYTLLPYTTRFRSHRRRRRRDQHPDLDRHGDPHCAAQPLDDRSNLPEFVDAADHRDHDLAFPGGFDAEDRAKLRFEEVGPRERSEEHTSELQSLMRISYAVFCLKKNKLMT